MVYNVKTLKKENFYPNLPGVRSDWTRPLILELLASGQGETTLKLLYLAGLEVKETAGKPGFKITQRK